MDFVAWNLLGLSRFGQNNTIKALFYQRSPISERTRLWNLRSFLDLRSEEPQKGAGPIYTAAEALNHAEHCLFQGSQASPVCPSDNNSIEMKENMEQWRNGTERGQPKYWDKNRFQCQSVQQESQMIWQLFEPGLPLWGVGDKLPNQRLAESK